MDAVAEPIQPITPTENPNLVTNADFSEHARTENEVALGWAISANPVPTDTVEVIPVDDAHALRFTLSPISMSAGDENHPYVTRETIITSTGSLGTAQGGDNFVVSFFARLDPGYIAANDDTKCVAFVDLVAALEDGESKRLRVEKLPTKDWAEISATVRIDHALLSPITAIYVNVGCYWENSSPVTVFVPTVSVWVKGLSVVRGPAEAIAPSFASADSPLLTGLAQVGGAAKTTILAALPGLEAVVDAKLKELIPAIAKAVTEKVHGATLSSLKLEISNLMSSVKEDRAGLGFLERCLIYGGLVGLSCVAFWSYRTNTQVANLLIGQDHKVTQRLNEQDESIKSAQAAAVLAQQKQQEEAANDRKATMSLATKVVSLTVAIQAQAEAQKREATELAKTRQETLATQRAVRDLQLMPKQ